MSSIILSHYHHVCLATVHNDVDGALKDALQTFETSGLFSFLSGSMALIHQGIFNTGFTLASMGTEWEIECEEEEVIERIAVIAAVALSPLLYLTEPGETWIEFDIACLQETGAVPRAQPPASLPETPE
jgi:hypothetical protein